MCAYAFVKTACSDHFPLLTSQANVKPESMSREQKKLSQAESESENQK